MDRTKLLAFNETEFYKDDNLGLRELHAADKIDFLSAPFWHMKFTLEWFNDNVVSKYLK